ncbi:MAG TPA: hypothetical protein VER04_29430 [Polyangiaceae bacterium]|nr:hypothetical protein [Polyangiaceae bacterium]
MSVLAMAAGYAACDSGGGSDGPLTVAGAGPGTAGAGAVQTGGSGAPGMAGSANAGTAALPEGVPLTPAMGWVAGDNAAGIEGAVFSFGDPTSKMGLVDNVVGPQACISGTAAKVDMASDACKNMMFTPPAKDCYGEYWGAAIGMNLNQKIDMTLVPPAGGTPGAYDASLLDGFFFIISGDVVPAPSAFRFKVEDGTNEFCNPAAIKIKTGPNTVKFSDLVSECWTTKTPPAPTADTVKNHLIKISWQVVTNASATVPFNFCVSDVRALVKPGATLPPVGTGSAGGGGAGAPGAAGGSAAGAPSGGAPSGGAPSGGAPSGGAAGASVGAGGAKAGGGGTAG